MPPRLEVAVAREQQRRHPAPLFQNQTSAQVKLRLDELKCNENTRWTNITVVPVGNGLFNILPRVDAVQVPHPHPENVNARSYGKGRLRKEISPYAQLYSWLKSNNWALQEPVPNVLEWTRAGGDLEQKLLQNPPVPLTPAQRNALPESLKRFRTMLLKMGVGLGNSYQKCTEYFGTAHRSGGVGSLLPNPSTKAFATHICPMAQLIKVSKNLYTRVLLMSAKMEEVKTYARCNPTQLNTPQFLKRVRGVWGMFHRQCMPAIVYIRAWCEYFGFRFHGSPFGPLFWYNLWGFYVHNALVDIFRRRQNAADARQRVQKPDLVDFRTILDPVSLHDFVRRGLYDAMPARRKNKAADGWDHARQRPIMPGPPPEMTSTALLQGDGWGAYFATLPAQWRQWLGTNVVAGKSYRYKQFAYNEDTEQLTTSSGNDAEAAVQFRFGSECLVNKPARRAAIQPPIQAPIPLYFFSA